MMARPAGGEGAGPAAAAAAHQPGQKRAYADTAAGASAGDKRSRRSDGSGYGQADPLLADLFGLVDQYGSGLQEAPADAPGGGAGAQAAAGAGPGTAAGALPPPLTSDLLASASRRALQDELETQDEEMLDAQAMEQWRRERQEGGAGVGWQGRRFPPDWGYGYGPRPGGARGPPEGMGMGVGMGMGMPPHARVPGGGGFGPSQHMLPPPPGAFPRPLLSGGLPLMPPPALPLPPMPDDPPPDVPPLPEGGDAGGSPPPPPDDPPPLPDDPPPADDDGDIAPPFMVESAAPRQPPYRPGPAGGGGAQYARGGMALPSPMLGPPPGQSQPHPLPPLGFPPGPPPSFQHISPRGVGGGFPALAMPGPGFAAGQRLGPPMRPSSAGLGPMPAGAMLSPQMMAPSPQAARGWNGHPADDSAGAVAFPDGWPPRPRGPAGAGAPEPSSFGGGGTWLS